MAKNSATLTIEPTDATTPEERAIQIRDLATIDFRTLMSVITQAGFDRAAFVKALTDAEKSELKTLGVLAGNDLPKKDQLTHHIGYPELQAQLRECRRLYKEALIAKVRAEQALEAKGEDIEEAEYDDTVVEAYDELDACRRKYNRACKKAGQKPVAAGGMNRDMARAEILRRDKANGASASTDDDAAGDATSADDTAGE